ncbi:P-loop NTPase fold protein [Sphingobacterium lactis]|uniref:P-loop NTPase fold protein n=1 Tax=Sphingobacterium lactis TaxID=797291 RepID=UPI003DA272D7
MNRIENVLLNYLQTETNHAILLTGDWGSGKTHYIKNVFFEKARDIRTIGSGATKSYKPILISLFGVKSIDDIKDRIWISLHSILDNKYAFYGTSIFKCIVKSADVSKLLGKGLLEGVIDNVGKSAKDISDKAKEKLPFDNLLICLDDLERTNKDHLKDDELLGFVNSLVEHDNNKVILIANGDKMDPERFTKIKEKTIGYTLHFEQRFQEVFENFISVYDSTPALKDFLHQPYAIIYDIFTKDGQGTVNYRTLKNVVSVFGQVYYVIETQGLGIAALEGLKQTILTDILRFTTGICIEFRKGKISYKERLDLEHYETLTISKILGKESQKDSFLMKFIDAYIKDENRYAFYTSIYETVTGGNIFNMDTLRQELRTKHHVVEDNIPIHYNLYNRLLEHDYLKIPDGEYKGLLRDLKNYAVKELYQIVEYPTILYILLRDDNPLYLNEQRLTNQFVRIVKKKKNSHKYHPLLSRHFSSDKDKPFSEFQERLISAILKINEESELKEADTKIEDLKQLFVRDFAEFFQRFLIFHYHRKGYFTFEGFSGQYLYKTFLQISNEHKKDFINLLYVGFLDNGYDIQENEQAIFTDLKNRIDNKLAKTNPRRNSTTLCQKLQEVLRKILISKVRSNSF